jgi:hypothetical protein
MSPEIRAPSSCLADNINVFKSIGLFIKRPNKTMIIIFVFFVYIKCNMPLWKGCEEQLNGVRKLERESRRPKSYARRLEEERLKNCGSKCQRHTHWVDQEVSYSVEH